MSVENYGFKDYERRKKDGFGQGKGKNYKPWITVRSASSHGVSSRICGWKTGRIHHFLSNLELSYFYMLEWSSIVKDIREKYPLPLETTYDLSERLQINHPANQRTKELYVMTTDFVIDMQTESGLTTVARTVLPHSELGKKRTIEKLELERMFWNDQGIDWGIVTEMEIPKEMVQNIQWIYHSYDKYQLPEGVHPDAKKKLNPIYIGWYPILSHYLKLPCSQIVISVFNQGFHYGWYNIILRMGYGKWI